MCSVQTSHSHHPLPRNLQLAPNGTGVSATPLAQNVYSFANETEAHEEGGHGEEEPSATESSVASATASGEAAATESATDSAKPIGGWMGLDRGCCAWCCCVDVEWCVENGRGEIWVGAFGVLLSQR